MTISVQIPTLNSDKTLELCLTSVVEQECPGAELLVIDSGSKDRTLKIARQCGAKVIECSSGLLWSRVRGIESTSADFVLLLDSDQILRGGVLARLSCSVKECDMVILEERALNPHGFLPKLYSSDRALSQGPGASTDPLRGVQMPRAFRTALIKRAASAIPKEVPAWIRYPDHAILYFECRRLSSRLGFVEDAVYHLENESFFELIKKHFRYGKDARVLSGFPRYSELVRVKASARSAPRHSEMFGPWVMAQTLLAIKAIPYLVGYHSAPSVRNANCPN